MSSLKSLKSLKSSKKNLKDKRLDYIINKYIKALLENSQKKLSIRVIA